jgi:acyl-CoA thioester hydrolase
VFNETGEIMGPVITARIRVRYGETDRMGIVYYANYLTWFEIGRTEFCRSLSKPYTLWEESGLNLPAVEAHVRYKNPLTYDETVLIETRIREVTSHSVSFSYRVKPEERSRLAAEGWTRHAFCGADGRLLREPEPFYGWLKELAGSSLEEVVPREQ